MTADGPQTPVPVAPALQPYGGGGIVGAGDGSGEGNPASAVDAIMWVLEAIMLPPPTTLTASAAAATNLLIRYVTGSCPLRKGSEPMREPLRRTLEMAGTGPMVKRRTSTVDVAAARFVSSWYHDLVEPAPSCGTLAGPEVGQDQRDLFLDMVIRCALDLAGRVEGLLVEARADLQSRDRGSSDKSA